VSAKFISTLSTPSAWYAMAISVARSKALFLALFLVEKNSFLLDLPVFRASTTYPITPFISSLRTLGHGSRNGFHFSIV